MPLRTIIIKATRSGTASTVIIRRGASGTGGGTGDHGELDGLIDSDDHTQYLNNARGDARYSSITYAGANPNHPQNLTITGVVTTGVNGTLVYCGLINGKAAWSSDGTQIAGVSNPSNTRVSSDAAGNIWYVERGSAYAAYKTSTAATPIGLTGWTVAIGAGPPVIAASITAPSIPVGTHIGQFCQASGGLWRWNGSAWFEVTATASSISNAAVLAALPSTTPLPISSGGTGASSAGAARTELGSKDVGDALFQAQTITDARGILGSQFKRRVANSSGNSTITLVADTELAGFVMEANAVYRVEYHLRFEGAGGVQARFNIPSDSGFPPIIVNGFGGAYTNGAAIDFLRRMSATQYRAVNLNTTPVASTGYGIIQIGPTGGTMDVTWGQSVSNIAPTIMLPWSFVVLTRIA